MKEDLHKHLNEKCKELKINKYKNLRALEIQDKIKWIMLACDHKKNWKNILVQTNNLDLHVMNKRALGRSYHQLVEMFNE